MKFLLVFAFLTAFLGCSPKPDTRSPEEQTGSKYGSGSGEVQGPGMNEPQQRQMSAQKAGTAPAERNTNAANESAGAPRTIR